MTEQVLSFFDNSGSPVLGLTPSITAISNTGDALFSGTMTEIGQGWYKYDIVGYDKTTKYLITVDGGVSLGASRYQYVTNELDSYDNKNDWKSPGVFIDNTAIAREVRALPKDKPRVGSYGEAVQEKTEFPEIVIPDIDFTDVLNAIKNIPKGKELSIEDIKAVIPEYDDKNILSYIKGMQKELLSKMEVEEDTTVIDGISKLEGFLSTNDDNLENIKELLSEYIELHTKTTEHDMNIMRIMLDDNAKEDIFYKTNKIRKSKGKDKLNIKKFLNGEYFDKTGDLFDIETWNDVIEAIDTMKNGKEPTSIDNIKNLLSSYMDEQKENTDGNGKKNDKDMLVIKLMLEDLLDKHK